MAAVGGPVGSVRTMTGPVALATCAETHAEADEAPIEAALARAGVAYEWAVWDDPGVDWARFAGVLVRTTWDYTDKIDAFRSWVGAVAAATRLWNPAAVLRWNSHKGYLVELAGHGVDVVPTLVARVGAAPVLETFPVGPSGEVVVKPAESAGSIGLSAWPGDDAGRLGALGAVDELHRAGQDAVLQPLVPEIRSGETSIMVIDGEITHAVRKVPAPGDIRSQPEWGAAVERAAVAPDQARLAAASIAAAAAVVGHGAEDLLYARVDCVDLGGRPHLMELELIEPDLYVGHDGRAADHLVAALRRRLER